MSSVVSLIPELEEALERGSAERRAQLVRRLTSCFLERASRLNDEHVGVFDEVLTRLAEGIETKARMELSRSLAPVRNAPVRVVRRLARDEDIAVAGPVLKQSPRLREADLIDIARNKSQAHLLVISGRAGIGEPVTDVLLRRGDAAVVRSLAGNDLARLSAEGLIGLVERAGKDDLLAKKVGRRTDIPSDLLADLVRRATAAVRQRLLAGATPERQAELRRVLAKVSRELGTGAGARALSNARATIAALQRRGELNESALLDFADRGQHEELVAALALLSGVAFEVVDHLVHGKRPDPILILSKSCGFGWTTAKAIIMARQGGGAAAKGLDAACADFERLSATTAQRVMRFWQVQADEAPARPSPWESAEAAPA
jgi:uncharacterized protein (DUF2336 family)